MSRNTYTLLAGVRYPDGGKAFWEVTKEAKATAFSNMPRVLVRAEASAEAIQKFKLLLDAAAKTDGEKVGGKTDRQAKFITWTLRGKAEQGYFVGTKIGSNHIALRSGIADVKEARRVIEEEADQLQAQLDKMRTIPNERRDENAPRVGHDHRGSVDVTPEAFQEAFGFRGVEFGNYVEGPRRQQDLNNAYDGLMDMAGILDIPSKAISLNGTLGLAFGARGSGGKNAAAAHYEPGKVVINLTKTQGRGSLAHEWFHAVDNYFAKSRETMRGTWITDNTALGGDQNQGVRPQIVNAFRAVRQAIAKTDLKKRSSNIDQLRSSPYWGTGIEMHARAFESYVIAKLQDQGASNDYLSNVVNGMSWGMQAELSGLGDSYPYLKPEELEVVRPAFDALFAVIETKETDKGVEMYSRRLSSGPIPNFGSRVDDVLAGVRRNEPVVVGHSSEVLMALGAPVAPIVVMPAVIEKAKAKHGLTSDQIKAALAGLYDPIAVFDSAEASHAPEGSFVVMVEVMAGRNEPVALAVHVGRSIGKTAVTSIASVHTRRTSQIENWIEQKLLRYAGHRIGSWLSRLGLRLPRAVVQGRREPKILGPEDVFNDDQQFSQGSESGRDDGNADPATENQRAGIVRDLEAAWSRLGLPADLRLRLVDRLFGMDSDGNTVPVDGSYIRGLVQVALDSVEGSMNTLHHEAIHALRDPALWGQEYGLFTKAEWAALEAEAKRSWLGKHNIAEMYGDLSLDEQIEEAIAAEFAQSLAAKREPDGAPVRRAIRKVAMFLKALGRALRGAGFQTSQSVFDAIMAGQVGSRGRVDGEGSPADQQSRRPGSDFAAEIMAQLAEVDELFQNPRAKSGNLKGVFSEVDPTIKFIGDTARPDEARESGANKRFLLRTAKGRDFFVYETDDSVWIDVSRLESGDGGNAIYQAIADYALNSGLEFIGDPAGLSDQALRRRTDNMLSSALKHGTTQHLTPHQRQLDGDSALGVPPLEWTDGDHFGNIRALIEVSVESLAHFVPEIRSASYDFETRTFRDAQGEPASDAVFRGWASSLRGMREAGVGRATLKRGILLNTLARSELSKRPGLLEQALRQSRKLVEQGGLDRTFYSRRPDGKFASRAVEYSRQLLKGRGPITEAKERGIIGQFLTDAMVGTKSGYSILALAPGEGLYRELAGNLPSAGTYIKLKHAMSAMRNERQGVAGEVSNTWRKFRAKNRKANEILMDLMHDATIAGIDPAEGFSVRKRQRPETQAEYDAMVAHRRIEYAKLRAKWDGMPKKAQDIYVSVRDSYVEAAKTEHDLIVQQPGGR